MRAEPLLGFGPSSANRSPCDATGRQPEGGFLLLLLGLSAGVAAASPDPTQYPGQDGPGRKGVKPHTPTTSTKPATVSATVVPRRRARQYTNDYGAPRPQGSHEGNDIMAPRRALAVATEAGKVKFWTHSAAAGCMLYLYGKSGTTYLYIHLNNDLTNHNDNRGKCVAGTSYAPGLKDGAKVQAGQLLGFVGDSGDANGIATHLHFEVHPHDGGATNPYPYLNRAYRPLFAVLRGRQVHSLGQRDRGLDDTRLRGHQRDAKGRREEPTGLARRLPCPERQPLDLVDGRRHGFDPAAPHRPHDCGDHCLARSPDGGEEGSVADGHDRAGGDEAGRAARPRPLRRRNGRSQAFVAPRRPSASGTALAKEAKRCSGARAAHEERNEPNQRSDRGQDEQPLHHEAEADEERHDQREDDEPNHRYRPFRFRFSENLSALEFRLSFLDEGRKPFLSVLAGEEIPEHVGLAREVGDVVALQDVVEGALGRGERERALGRDQPRGLERALEQLFGLVHRVDEADPQRLLGIHDSPGEDELLRDAERRRPARGAACRPSRG